MASLAYNSSAQVLFLMQTSYFSMQKCFIHPIFITQIIEKTHSKGRFSRHFKKNIDERERESRERGRERERDHFIVPLITLDLSQKAEKR